jgi:hypothetical protein
VTSYQGRWVNGVSAGGCRELLRADADLKCRLSVEKLFFYAFSLGKSYCAFPVMAAKMKPRNGKSEKRKLYKERQILRIKLISGYILARRVRNN